MAIKRIATAVLLALVSIMVITIVLVSSDTTSDTTSAEPELASNPVSHQASELPVEYRVAVETSELDNFFTAVAVAEYIKNVQVQEYVQAVALNEYFAAVHQAEVDAYNAAQAAQQQQQQRQQQASAPSSSGGTTVGACTGFAIPDYIIQRESGGNPNAYNPSGAYGCAQTLLSHYSGGSCSGLDPYTIEGQRQCVLILSNGGTNLAPWAETR